MENPKFNITKQGNIYSVLVNIEKPRHALLLDGILNSSKLQRMCLKYHIDLEYNTMDGKGDSVDFIIAISGDFQGVSKVDKVAKTITLLKSSLQTP